MNKGHIDAYVPPDNPLLSEVFDKVTKEMMLSIFRSYKRISNEVQVRISQLPLFEELHNSRILHFNQLVRSFDVVAAASGILATVKCSYILGHLFKFGMLELIQDCILRIEPGFHSLQQ